MVNELIVSAVDQSGGIYNSYGKPSPRAFAHGLGSFTPINPCQLGYNYYLYI